MSSPTLSEPRRTLRNKVSELHTRPAPSTSLELEYNKRLMVVAGRANPELAHRIASKLGVELKAILLTHTHFDHVGAVAELNRLTGAPVWCPELEVEMLRNINDYVFPGMPPLEPYEADETYAGGETLRALCDGLGAQGLLAAGLVTPGVPRSRLLGGAWDGLAVISKSGAFGPDALWRDLLAGNGHSFGSIDA